MLWRSSYVTQPLPCQPLPADLEASGLCARILVPALDLWPEAEVWARLCLTEAMLEGNFRFLIPDAPERWARVLPPSRVARLVSDVPWQGWVATETCLQQQRVGFVLIDPGKSPVGWLGVPTEDAWQAVMDRLSNRT